MEAKRKAYDPVWWIWINDILPLHLCLVMSAYAIGLPSFHDFSTSSKNESLKKKKTTQPHYIITDYIIKVFHLFLEKRW